MEILGMMDAADDDFLFHQGATKGLGKIQFHDYRPAFDRFPLPNVKVFQEQIEVFREFLTSATPDDQQKKDIDFLMSLGEIFTLVVYAQLILENSRIYKIDNDLVDQMFDFMVRDFSKFALQLLGKTSSTPEQVEYCRKMLRKPAVDAQRYGRVWENYLVPLKDLYKTPE